MTKVWSASEARANFSDLLNDAVAGQTDTTQQCDGTEILIVSKKLFMTGRSSLAHYLANLDTGLTEQQATDWFEAMREAQGKD